LRRPSLRSQLNQIRLWVRQGRTDAWIAHKLDISVEQLQTFKRDQGLNGESDAPAASPPPVDLASIDEIDVASEEDDGKEAPLTFGDELDLPELEPEAAAEEEADAEADRDDEQDDRESERGDRTRRRRRGRRGGRRRSSRAGGSFEATFDHGDEGYGLWLDPAVAKDDVYSEHWAGHRAVSVTVEPDAITIRRVEVERSGGDENGD
jgi:hypothetical protein